MQTVRQKMINKTLALNGLATMDNPRALLQQIAFVVKDHDKFRNLIMTVEPEKRYLCYNSLRSLLGFAAKPLDTYVAEAKMEAERLKLPEYDAATMSVKDHGQQASDAAMSKAIHNALLSSELGLLELTCRKCTFAQTFRAPSRRKAVGKAHREGWKKEGEGLSRKFLCPTCSGRKKAVVQ